MRCHIRLSLNFPQAASARYVFQFLAEMADLIKSDEESENFEGFNDDDLTTTTSIEMTKGKCGLRRIYLPCFKNHTAIMMGINSLPQLAMYWSENGNIGIQSVMTKNRFEELCQYLHFSDTTKEPKRGEPNYDRLFKIRPVLNDVLDKAKNTYEP